MFEAENGRVDQVALRDHLRALADRFVILRLRVRSPVFELPAQLLELEGWPVEEVPQSPSGWGAAEFVFRQIVAEEIIHDGDPVLCARERGGLAGVRTEAGSLADEERGPIDALTAGILATYVADVAPAEDEAPPPDLALSVW